MGTFFTSDWHVGHANVLVFDQRPFKDLGHMHEILIRNWNLMVKPDDTGFFLGDMGLGKWDAVGAVVARLNGRKIVVLGNHDKSAGSMLLLGFAAAVNMASICIGKSLVTMTHCPLRGIWRESVESMKGAAPGEHWHGESRHAAFSIPDFGQDLHLHGHTHKTPKERVLGKQWDVGVRANDYKPVSIRQLESFLAKGLIAP